jgi:hypothetical protein
VAVAEPLRSRQTNLDLVAAALGASAAPNDLIIVNPWFFGVTFHRYYSGPAPWMAVPDLGKADIHRYDRLKQCMQDPTCVEPVARAAAGTLAVGGRVWLVGGLPRVPWGTVLEPPPPAPTSALGWNIDGYDLLWGRVVMAAVQPHIKRHGPVPVAAPGPVSPYESVAVFRLDGSP